MKNYAYPLNDISSGSNIVLDQEWLSLIIQAKELGLTKEEICEFLKTGHSIISNNR